MERLTQKPSCDHQLHPDMVEVYRGMDAQVQQVFDLHYGKTGQCLTAKEIGFRLGLTRNRVNQLILWIGQCLLNPAPLRKNRLVYVAGKYTGKDSYKVSQNIQAASELQRALLSQGHTTIVPHRLFAGYERESSLVHIDYEGWMTHCFRLLESCTDLVLHPNWIFSAGSRRERVFAKGRGISTWESRCQAGVWEFRPWGGELWRNDLL